MKPWTYGDAWERYPIQPGEIWGEQRTGSKVAVHDLCQPLPAFMECADLLCIDPPWNLGNLNAFYTKAGRTDYHRVYASFLDLLFARIVQVGPVCCYIEIGRQAVDDCAARLGALFPVVQRWPVTYYRRSPCWLLRGAADPTARDYTGWDEEDCIRDIPRREGHVVGDLCMGRGLVGVAAYAAGKCTVGTELHPRRLACLLLAWARHGGQIVRHA